MTYDSDHFRPWQDGGDEVILQNHVPRGAVGHPFEVYYYQPRPGYGHLKFNKQSIQLEYPSARKDSSLYLGDLDLDGDADFDADDIGCLVAILVALGLGYLFKSARDKSRQDEFGIIWPLELKYNQIEGIKTVGRTLVINSGHRKRMEFKLRVALEDGERLYRELSLRYPRALQIPSDH